MHETKPGFLQYLKRVYWLMLSIRGEHPQISRSCIPITVPEMIHLPKQTTVSLGKISSIVTSPMHPHPVFVIIGGLFFKKEIRVFVEPRLRKVDPVFPSPCTWSLSNDNDYQPLIEQLRCNNFFFFVSCFAVQFLNHGLLIHWYLPASSCGVERRLSSTFGGCQITLLAFK